jgi:hypothetical protein
MRRDGDEEMVLNFDIEFPDLLEEEWIDSGIRMRVWSEFQNRVWDRSLPRHEQFPAGKVHDESAMSYVSEVAYQKTNDAVITLSVTATVIFRTPTRGDSLDLLLDSMAYRDGSSFRAADGDVLIVCEGILFSRVDHGWISLLSDEYEKAPISLLWEPVVDMTEDEVNEGDYSLEDGIPARVRVAMDDNIFTSLSGGAL